MSGERSAVEKFMEDIFVDLMTEKVVCGNIGIIDWRIESIPLDWTSV
jgi:hypothetical protein